MKSLSLANKTAWIQDFDVIFFSETHGKTYDIVNFELKIINDASNPSRGGLAMYIKNEIAHLVKDVNKNECFVSFKIDTIPDHELIGVYIPPIDSEYYHDRYFADLNNKLLENTRADIKTLIGGDFNSRPGDLNKMELDNYTFSENVDRTTNAHGTLFTDMCRNGNVTPLNHLQHGNKNFPGKHTFYRGNRKSQIDFVITNRKGLDIIEELKFIENDWHISDHIPISTKISIPHTVDLKTLHKRSCDINALPQSCQSKITELKKYDVDITICTTILQTQREELTKLMEENIIDPAKSCDILTENLQNCLFKAVKESKIRKFNRRTNETTHSLNNANAAFQNYSNAIENNLPTHTQEQLAYTYETARNKITPEMLKCHHDDWKKKIEKSDDKEIWKKIDWNGKLKKQPPPDPPEIDDLKKHFEEPYSKPDDENVEELEQLKSDVYIPELDDPINQQEVMEAGKQMKKGGYDLPNKVVSPMLNTCLDVIHFLMNLIFSFHHPMLLGISLLCALPKKGNLKLPRNYRGIQMMPLIAGLYDRIIANRLTRWIKVNYEQTAFQKGKSTIHHIMTIRLITAICKKTKEDTLYSIL